jgi:hypothetical protein
MPFLKGWLGPQPRSPLTLLDLPDPEDTPFETGALLAAPLREAGPKANPGALNGVLVHALTHAWIILPTSPPPPPAWLNEGVAQFIGTLWVEKQQGRDSALRSLEADRAALALVEPASPGLSPGQPLPSATSPVYYRTKAAYVLWMLRDLAGDPALSAVLRAYYPAVSAPATDSLAAEKHVLEGGSETEGGGGFNPRKMPTESTRALAPEGGISENSIFPANRTPSPFEKLLEASDAHPDLAWFFADWVNADKGLPDLAIDGIFPTSASAGNWLVAVHVANAGYAAADVPVTVRSGSGADARSVTQRVRVPARGKAIQRILIQGKPLEVQVNDGTVPETQASIHITKLEEPAQAPPGSSQSNPPK